jgi:hypothetical protein
MCTVPAMDGHGAQPMVCVAEETHDDRHSVCSSLDEALKDRRVLREGFNPFHPGAKKGVLVDVRLL